MLRLIHKTLLDLFFPKKCLGCAGAGKYLCPACFDRVFEPDIRETRSLKIVISAAVYANPIIRLALRQLKYQRSRDLKNELAELMLQAAKFYLASGLEIMAIPMTYRRKRQRGFNQAELLARALAEKAGLIFKDGLIKIRETAPQAEIKDRKERLKNIKGAFALRPGFKPAETVILVDDISTTGATLSEAARVLKKAGAKNVIGVVVAR